MRDPRSLFLGVALGAVLALSPVSRAELPIGNQFAAAIESGSLERVQALVDKGNGPDTLIEYGENKITPLMKASWEGELAIVEYLLAKGANLEYTNADGQTALHEAIGREHADVVAFNSDLDSLAGLLSDDAAALSPRALAFALQYLADDAGPLRAASRTRPA